MIQDFNGAAAVTRRRGNNRALVDYHRLGKHSVISSMLMIAIVLLMMIVNGMDNMVKADSCNIGELGRVSKWFRVNNETALSELFFLPSALSELAGVNLIFAAPIPEGNSSEPIIEFEATKNCEGRCFSMIDNSTYYLMDSYEFYFPRESFNNSHNVTMGFIVWDKIGVLNVDPKSMRILVRNKEEIIDSSSFKDGLQFDLGALEKWNIENITIQIVSNSKPIEKEIQMGENVDLSYHSSFSLPLTQFPDRRMRLLFSQPSIPIQFNLNPYNSKDMKFHRFRNREYIFLDAFSFTFKTDNGTANIPDYISRLTIKYTFESINNTRTDINGKQVNLLDDSLLVATQFEGVFYESSYTKLASNTSEILQFELNPIKNQTVLSIMGQTEFKPSPVIHKVYEQINGTIKVGENIYFAIPISNSRKLVMEGNFNTLSKSDETKLEIYIQDDVYDSIPLPSPVSFSEKFTLLPKQEKRKFNLPISETTKNIAFLLQCSSTDPSEQCSFSFQVYTPSPVNDLVVPLSVSNYHHNSSSNSSYNNSSGRSNNKNNYSTSSYGSYNKKRNYDDYGKYNKDEYNHDGKKQNYSSSSSSHHNDRGSYNKRNKIGASKCRDLEDAFPFRDYKLAKLAGLDYKSFVPEESQLLMMNWILDVRDENCPLLSYSKKSRSKNTLIDGFAGVGATSLLLIRKSGSFDNIVAVENNREIFECLKDNLKSFKFNDLVNCVNQDFMDWMRESYSKVEYFKSIIYVDIDLFSKTKLFESAEDKTNSLCEMSREILEDLECPLLIFRGRDEESEALVKQIEGKCKTRKIIENRNIQDGHTMVAILPILESDTDKETDLDKNGLPTVLSQKQFSYVWFNSAGDIKKRFIQILSKQMLRKCFKQQEIVQNKIGKIIEQYEKDQEIYDQLYNLFQNEIFKSREYLQENPVNLTKMTSDSSVDTSYRANNRSSKIKEILPSNAKIRNMLDIGCSEGSITAVVGTELGLSKENIHGCDVRDIGKSYTTGFTFTLISEDNNKLPYESNSFSLVVALMSLHHIKNVEETIKEIHRVLEPGGVFIIREHDCTPTEISLVLDIMHGLYSMVWSSPREMPNFCTEYYAEYRSREEWSNLISSLKYQDGEKLYGFEVDYSEDVDQISQQTSSSSSYRRNQDIRNPFRSYHSVFIKKEL
ncbi:predicted protein [Naegleria gruberi]|uniref:Predicted protein n=1 Tax=Naegleria gruberi TaxID=5762 RepID=D2VJL6_NAEGR|nr:uncharacterized protein NAEGRDRAFT_69083 [Naegleria gruberi]EFC43055.1 predicted protein [Naegleria gruberi]|eukprot:XP_002675799.1 predicted protein [Naegleria gruberi strain NEG-M]